MKKASVALFLILLVSGVGLAGQNETVALDKLADDFWSWRAKYAPFTGDDVNRGSRAKIDNHRQELAEFETRWKPDRQPGSTYRSRKTLQFGKQLDGLADLSAWRNALRSSSK